MKLCTAAILLALAAGAWAGVEEDWQQIIALDAGPKAEWKTRAEARTVTLAHLDRQEKALRDFVAKHPTDPRAIDAQLRLAHLLVTRSDLQENAKARAEAVRLLDRLSKDAPEEKRADVEFAKISLAMRRLAPGDETARATLFNKAQTFEKSFPTDRRLAPLFAEIATLYDAQPRQKKELLERARARATDDELKQRIEDDLKRIALLGQPVALKFTATDGREIVAEKLHGKVVVIFFFASWSPPAIAALDIVRNIVAEFPRERVQPLGISLDEDRVALDTTLRTHKIDWPVFCDGKAWQSPLVRGFGINALPTLWILDRGGKLRALNAKDEAATLITQLLRER